MKNDEGVEEIKSFVINEPEIRELALDPMTDDFILLASDGLYDKFSSQEAVDCIRSSLESMSLMEQDPQVAVNFLIKKALQKGMIQDNITAVIATFNRGIQL